MLIIDHSKGWQTREVSDDYYKTSFWVNDAQQSDGTAVNPEEYRTTYNSKTPCTIKVQNGMMREVVQ